jgi:hypothetical protein
MIFIADGIDDSPSLSTAESKRDPFVSPPFQQPVAVIGLAEAVMERARLRPEADVSVQPDSFLFRCAVLNRRRLSPLQQAPLR